jgi:hypothetical protein
MGDECDAFFMSVLETVMLSKYQTEGVPPVSTGKPKKI